MTSGDKKNSRIKLLVPVNFSVKSEMALDFALTYSQGMSADIYLFHVFEEATKNFRRLDRLNEEYMERMKQMVNKSIERVHAKGVQHTVKDVHRRMAHGRAPAEILKMADAISADVIIMGAATSSAFQKLALKAPCSLVLLKEKDLT